MLVDHIRQLRSNHRTASNASSQIQSDRPPAYEDVVKNNQDLADEPDSSDIEIQTATQSGADQEPPSYVEATNNAISSSTSTSSTSTSAGSTSIEVNNSSSVTVQNTPDQVLDENQHRMITVVTVESSSN